MPVPDGPDACCEEYAALSRRGVLRAGAALLGASATTSVLGSAVLSTSYAAGAVAPGGPVLVVVSLRGAADGLSLVVPHADPVYRSARPRTAVPTASLLAADATFGLHPALAPLLPWWQQGRMAAVHAAGLPVANRSHFAAMEELEDAAPGSSTRSGWLNRLVGRRSEGPVLRAVQIGSASAPMSLAGPTPAVALADPDLDDAGLAGTDAGGDLRGARARSLRAAWGGTRGRLPGDVGGGALDALTALGELGGVRRISEKPQHGARYPQGDLGDALRAAARTVRADVGAEVLTLDHGSWDMHRALGTVAEGAMREMTGELARGLAAFLTDLGHHADRTTVVVLTEFGRRVAENGAGGFDHGHGGVVLLLGAGVRGGYHGRWPGLRTGADADLPVTTDYRSILAEVVRTRFRASVAEVFPGFVPEVLDVVRASLT